MPGVAETVLLPMLVRRAGRLSLEKRADWLARYDALAAALGYAPVGSLLLHGGSSPQDAVDGPPLARVVTPLSVL